MTPDELRALRKRLGLTQAALARRIGVSERQVIKYESGDATPRSAALKALLDLRPTAPEVLIF